MVPLTRVLTIALLIAQTPTPAPEPTGDTSGLLIGIGAILAALVPLGVALVHVSRNRGNDDDAEDDERIADARERIAFLRGTIKQQTEVIRDIEERERTCLDRARHLQRDLDYRQSLDQVKAMEIGSLQGLLAETRRERDQLREERDQAIDERDSARAELAELKGLP